MSEIQKTAENYISDRLAEILPKLSKDELRFVVALQEYKTKKDAAEAIGLEPQTVYRWNGLIDEATKLLAQDALESARQIRRRAIHKAILVKLAGLDSQDEGTRQRVATELIEWELGKAQQRTDVTTAGEPLQRTSGSDGLDRSILTLADAIREKVHGTDAGGQSGMDAAK